MSEISYTGKSQTHKITSLTHIALPVKLLSGQPCIRLLSDTDASENFTLKWFLFFVFKYIHPQKSLYNGGENMEKVVGDRNKGSWC